MRLPSARVHIYGSYPAKEMMELHDPAKGFLMEGWAKDAVVSLAQHRVNLACVRFGAGIKGKITDGWLAGTPAAATSVG
jgi:hypothetical protein